MKKYSEKIASDIMKSIKDAKEVESDGSFEVIATTGGVDRDGESIDPKGWDFSHFMKNPVLLWGHDYTSPPIGVVRELKEQDGKIIASGVFARTQFAQEVRSLYDDGILRTVSVGFIPKDRDGKNITAAELLELSFVPVPANPEAVSLRRVKSLEKAYAAMVKTTVPYGGEEPLPMDREWDPSGARERILEWATGVDGEVDFDMYAKGFAWFDSSNADTLQAYQLPHHDVAEGQLKTHWRGVVDAMGALLGGADIPEGDREAVYTHLARHYEQFGEEAPEFSSSDNEEEKSVTVDEEKQPIRTAIMSEEGVKAFSKSIKDDLCKSIDEAVLKLFGLDGEKEEEAAEEPQKSYFSASNEAAAPVTKTKGGEPVNQGEKGRDSLASDAYFDVHKALKNIDIIVEKTIVQVKKQLNNKK